MIAVLSSILSNPEQKKNRFVSFLPWRVKNDNFLDMISKKCDRCSSMPPCTDALHDQCSGKTFAVSLMIVAAGQRIEMVPVNGDREW